MLIILSLSCLNISSHSFFNLPLFISLIFLYSNLRLPPLSLSIYSQTKIDPTNLWTGSQINPRKFSYTIGDALTLVEKKVTLFC